MFVTANTVRLGNDNSWKVYGTSRNNMCCGRDKNNIIAISNCECTKVKQGGEESVEVSTYKITVSVEQLNWAMNLSVTRGMGGGYDFGEVFMCLTVRQYDSYRYGYGYDSRGPTYSSCVCESGIIPQIYKVIPGKKYYVFTVNRIPVKTLKNSTTLDRTPYANQFVTLGARLLFVHRDWAHPATGRRYNSGNDPDMTAMHPLMTAYQGDDLFDNLQYSWNCTSVARSLIDNYPYSDFNLIGAQNSHGDTGNCVVLYYNTGKFNIRPWYSRYDAD